MTTYFADTSALMKRYVSEIGSAWVVSWIVQPAGNVTFVSELSVVEVFSALSRRQLDGTLSSSVVTTLQNNFLLHFQKEYLVVNVDTPILTQARNLVARYPVRTLDALQLASAIHATTTLGEPMTFVSADPNLLAAANAEGFTTDDPKNHP